MYLALALKLRDVSAAIVTGLFTHAVILYNILKRLPARHRISGLDPRPIDIHPGTSPRRPIPIYPARQVGQPRRLKRQRPPARWSTEEMFIRYPGIS